MYQPIHLKYRPQSFAELVGQQAIATTLSNAISSVRIAPAYLFTGPRGTGKTSSARIFAKSLNCLAAKSPTTQPCGNCNSCQAIALGTSLDVIELDAASNSGVDNIRELIERCQFAALESRYKVFIIDECHSLSSQGWQALLKTLEEPPANVVFLLCTTEVHKVPATIASRCQKFDFKRIGVKAMVEHLQHIVKGETIDITPEALKLIAQLSSGCLRDAECLLDQLSLLDTTINQNWVWEIAGMVPEHELLTLVEQITVGNVVGVKTILDSMIEDKEPLVILGEIIKFFKTMLIALCSPSPESGYLTGMFSDNWSDTIKVVSSWNEISIQETIKHLTSRYSLVKSSELPHLFLEVSVMEIIKLAPNSTNVPNSVPQRDLMSQQPWRLWSSPDDAISWAKELLPYVSVEELTEKWNRTPSVNGKKSTEWVKEVQKMLFQSPATVKLTTV
ncbi:hypothetical protein WA1_50385 [Scytonema hofmannii PCC 7110]|uniref:DNA polymerase III subunit gamma/tau n=1 Tax=Scytonema hofmannii PCC 7110 TaxID=128403 RepID=A0A139WR77_9CYAN|nr:DNA polymerase III subunit gamma/tau [Scytonema hofmannii]KYC34934.1 hypothetical protein WA1_50385 [Scytonema hofmannii PCC 7110]